VIAHAHFYGSQNSHFLTWNEMEILNKMDMYWSIESHFMLLLMKLIIIIIGSDKYNYIGEKLINYRLKIVDILFQLISFINHWFIRVVGLCRDLHRSLKYARILLIQWLSSVFREVVVCWILPYCSECHSRSFQSFPHWMIFWVFRIIFLIRRWLKQLDIRLQWLLVFPKTRSDLRLAPTRIWKVFL